MANSNNFKVGDYVTCSGEGDDVFQISLINKDNFGFSFSAYLTAVNVNRYDGGWKSFTSLKLTEFKRPQYFYNVDYSRLSLNKRHTYINVRMSEENLKLILLDNDSRYKYIVLSAKLIENDKEGV